MDDTTRQPASSQPVNQSVPAATGANPVNQINRIIEPPTITSHPEQGPHQTIRVEMPQETAQESSQEAVISSELEHIVERSVDTETPVIPKEAQQAGVTVSQVAAPVPDIPSDADITLPIQYDQAVLLKKKSRIGEAIKWFAALIVYQWKKINPNIGKKTQ